MPRAARVSLACVLLWTLVVAMTSANRGPQLKAGLFLFAAPGLTDPNFAKTVVVLLQHGAEGSLGLVVNRPTDRTVRDVFDEKLDVRDSELPVYWGGPVQPQAVMALVRAPRPGPHARTVVPEVQLTQDLDDVKATLAARDGPLRVRVFSGYAGWGPDQLETEVRRGAWVLEPADAASVFTPEPSRLWERVREILGRVVAADWRDPRNALAPHGRSASVSRRMPPRARS